MRKRVFSAVLTFGLAVMAVTIAYAQLPGTAVRAKIPFNFTVRGKVLPAGNYAITRLTDDPNTLMISNVKDNHDRVVFATEPVEPGNNSSRSEIIFHRYGEDYFLSEVFGGGAQTGRELPPSREERLLKREMASNKAKPETVAVVAY